MTDKRWKEALTAKTQEALDRGAFGAPFFWVVKTDDTDADVDVDGQGKVVGEEPFFGSDRYVFIYLSFASMGRSDVANGWIGFIKCGSIWDCRLRISNFFHGLRLSYNFSLIVCRMQIEVIIMFVYCVI